MMKNLILIACIILTTFNLTTLNAQTPLSNTFTYQGELKLNNVLANGSYDIEFSVFDVVTGGSVLEIVTVTGVTVTNGVFTTPITLNNDLFIGNKIWLSIAVRTAGTTDPFDVLMPRQEVTSTPYAIHAQFVGTVGADAVTGVQIQNGSITLNDMHSNSVDSTTIVDNSITSTDIAADAITDVELANNAVDTLALQDNAVTSVKIADGSVAASDIDSTQVQRRVAMSCPDGQYLKGINQDGSVMCQMLPVNSSALVDFVDESVFLNGVIAYPSIAINQNNLPVISYFLGNTTASELRVVACTTPNCSSFNPFIKLDDVFFQGYSKVVIGSNNLPRIFYLTNVSGNTQLKMVACTVTNCSNFSTPILLDTNVLTSNWGFKYEPLDVIIGSNGIPVITYIGKNGNVRDLRVIACLQQSCATFNAPLVLVNNIATGLHVSTIFGANGKPVLAYHDGSNIYVITCSSLDCSTSNAAVQVPYALAAIDSLAMTLGAGGLPIIAISFNSIVELNCNAVDCSTITSSIFSIDTGGYDLQLSLGLNNKPVITHYNRTTKDIRLVHCFDTACNNKSSIITIDNNNAFSETTSAKNQNNNSIFAYYYAPNNSSYLKVFSCGNESCQN